MSQYFDNKDLFMGPIVNQYGSHMLMTDVKKETKTKYINIDTKFREEYNENFLIDYNINLPERINDVHSISVTHLEVPIYFYNISSALNNNFLSQDGDVKILRDHQYTESEILVELNDKTTGLTFDISYNKLQITNSGADTTIRFDVDKYGNFDKYNLKSKLGWSLGFRKQSYTIPSGESILGEALINLNIIKYLYLAIDEMNSSGHPNSFQAPLFQSNINKNVISRMALNRNEYGFGKIQSSNTGNGLLSNTRTYSGNTDIGKLNIKLLNEFGEIMDLNGQDISFCLEIKYD